jgi:hypothetical protein
MSTKRQQNKKNTKATTKKSWGGQKWKTAMDAAKGTLKKTGSLTEAKKSLRKQALSNARKLFGSI